MNKRELMELLKDLPDDMEILGVNEEGFTGLDIGRCEVSDVYEVQIMESVGEKTYKWLEYYEIPIRGYTHTDSSGTVQTEVWELGKKRVLIIR